MMIIVVGKIHIKNMIEKWSCMIIIKENGLKENDMSWRDEEYTDSEKALLIEVRRLRQVIRELEEKNQELEKLLEQKIGDGDR